MRWTLAAVMGALLLFQSAYFRCPQPSLGPECSPSPAAANRCQADRENHPGAVCLEDRRLQSNLIRQGVALIERGRTVGTSVLCQQLAVASCQLELPQSAPTASDSAGLFLLAKDSVVVVGALYKCNNCSRWHADTASGFVISSHGAVVTNYHVVNSSTEQALVVMTADSRVYPVERVLAASRADDLAILKVDAEELSPLALAAGAAAAPVGSPVSIISHPDGRFYCYTAGVVSRYMKTELGGEAVDAVAVTAEYARGSSGAPVLNQQGHVVAVVSSTESIYYSEDEQRQRNLQMVFRTCVPAASLLKLIRPTAHLAGRTP
ncbi:MAG: trypsin-like peptidase domain-containing protein [Candidatus Anammoximicrobium sp.]|nr:trypsin-like peptidase domain-containing protein [Candidatus Anammoximicrobium sp.]